MRLVILIYLLLIGTVLSAQNNFVKQWGHSYGGTMGDAVSVVLPLQDKGYLLCGYTYSPADGDLNQPNWDGSLITCDYWIIKVDNNGNKLWERRYGGTGDDGLLDAIETNDQGFVLAGGAYSGQNGDKTDPIRGMSDYWIVKIDSSGNMLWNKGFGGIGMDMLPSIGLTNDGGFMLMGRSDSPVSGDKTAANHGSIDYWIIRTDSLGNKLWDKAYGASGFDAIFSSAVTRDGGCILGGRSSSPANGDKSEDSFNGGVDYWAIKIDSLGNKQWDRTFGGTATDDLLYTRQTYDNGYILAGTSISDMSGNKSSAKRGYWLVKTDSAGNKLWDKAYGDEYFDGKLYGFSLTSDGGYLMSGSTTNGVGGDKTESNLGEYQGWIVKIDSLGNREWDKTIFSNGYNFTRACIEAENGCFIVGAGFSKGEGGYIDQSNWDTTESSGDIWLAKFCMEPLGVKEFTNSVNVTVYPNPFANELSISVQKLGLGNAIFTILGTSGELVYQSNETNLADSYTKILDMSKLSAGLYYIIVEANGYKVTKQVVKE